MKPKVCTTFNFCILDCKICKFINLAINSCYTVRCVEHTTYILSTTVFNDMEV